MKIVIPMAGFGTRLRPHTWSKPKPLVPVAGKPVLGHVLDMFSGLPTLDEVVFIVGYLGDQIEAYMTEHHPELKARFVVQDEMLGQSHALWLAREGLVGPMFLAFVDTLIDVDLSDGPSPSDQAIAWVKRVEDPRRFGVAQVDAQGRVERLVEKPRDPSNNLALVGFYYFPRAEDLVAAVEKQMQADMRLGGEFYLVDAINVLLEQGLQMRAETVSVWEDCGKPDALLDTNRYLLANGHDNSRRAAEREGVTIVPPVFIDPSAQISSSSIGPFVSIGPDCHIRDAAIENSIVERGARIESARLERSLIGAEAIVTGGHSRLDIGDNSRVELL